MTGYAVARLSEIEETETDVPFRAIRQHFGIMSFGVSASTARADGDVVVKEHTESHPDAGDELYIVLTGRARFQLDGAAHDAPAGTLVHVAPAVTRSAVALEAGTTVLSFGAGAPGTPYVPNGWDVFAPLFGLFERGEYELGADRAQALIADDPPYAGVYYNTACFESRCGRITDALAHLRRAVELSPAMAELAREDEDLAALRGEAGFAELVGEAPPAG